MAVNVSALPAKRFPSVNTLHSIAAGCPMPLNVSLYMSDSVNPALQLATYTPSSNELRTTLSALHHFNRCSHFHLVRLPAPPKLSHSLH